MRNFLEIDETPPALDRSFKTVTKLRRELPTDIQMESIPHNQLPSLAEEIHAKHWKQHKILILIFKNF